MFGSPDWWSAFQLDKAISHFGIYIENKLSEYDKDGKPVYELNELLDNKQNGYSRFLKAFGSLVTE